ncbi:hypothetical protein RB653_004135 [Dictyostelium firmibasis]|uniref:Di19 zinc-binding domain-containing protein n=1 Tax=Dictyostelium firmibasis TaxID=79012 RepID=A0AAN7U7D5_9MYCE
MNSSNNQSLVIIPCNHDYFNNSNNNSSLNNSPSKCIYSCETCSNDCKNEFNLNDENEYFFDDEENQELFKMFGNFNNQEEIYACPYLNCLSEGYDEQELALHLLKCHQEQLLKSIYIVCPLCTNERHDGNFINHIKKYHLNK